MAERKRRKEKSGVLIYFEIEPALARLEDADKGKLLTAMLQYSHYGIPPAFDTDVMALTWAFIQPKIDRDTENWENACAGGAYAAYCREAQKEGTPLDYDTWYKEIYQTSPDVGRQHPQPIQSITIQSITEQGITNANNISYGDKPPGKDIYTDDFERFWNAYPRPMNKQSTFKAFKRVIKQVSVDTLIQAIEKQKATIWKDRKVEYIPYSTTWLNQSQWENDTTANVGKKYEYSYTEGSL